MLGAEVGNGGRSNLDAPRQVDRCPDGDADEGCGCGVRPRLAEQRVLELGVGAVEGAVLPVETAARLGCLDQEPDKDPVEEPAVGGLAAGEDRSRRLTAQLGGREPGVLELCE
jgi:hypothetical protein